MPTLLTWNLLHGGGHKRMAPITLCLLSHNADVLLLTEFRRATGGQIAGILADHGWHHQISTDPPRSCNGLLLASRSPLSAAPTRDARLIEADFPDLGFALLGVHIPCASTGSPVRAGPSRFWKHLLARAEFRATGPCLVFGDFNTGRHRRDQVGATLPAPANLDRLEALGYVDAWRVRAPQSREYSWFSAGGDGFRIDHAFASRTLAQRVSGAFYSHAEREDGLSDHSAFLVELAA